MKSFKLETSSHYLIAIDIAFNKLTDSDYQLENAQDHCESFLDTTFNGQPNRIIKNNFSKQLTKELESIEQKKITLEKFIYSVKDSLKKMSLKFYSNNDNLFENKTYVRLTSLFKFFEQEFHSQIQILKPSHQIPSKNHTYFERLLTFELLRRNQIIKLDLPNTKEEFQLISSLIGQKDYVETRKKYKKVTKLFNDKLTQSQISQYLNQIIAVKDAIKNTLVMQNHETVLLDLDKIIEKFNK